MKRYNYHQWFKRIMDMIPIKILRVLVFLIVLFFIMIGRSCEAFTKAFKDFMSCEQFKEMIGDVWHWEERGETLNGKYNH